MSYAETTEIIMPGDTNHYGTAFGGKIMELIDKIAAIASYRFARNCVTASIDSLEFKHPIQLGDIITLKAHVNQSWTPSMEVGVKVICHSKKTGEEFKACRAFLTFVAVDENGKRREIENEIKPETARNWRWFNEAEERRELRLKARKK